MPTSVNQYKLLISCPGDVVDEINIIEEVIDSFNQQFSETLGVSILPKHWTKSAYPQSGDKPQNLLNEQFVKDCDAAVAIFWTRFGTPTDKYKSGSEEEINIMLDAGKQVFLYFCEKDPKPGYDAKQHALIKAFKKKYKNKGLYWSYDSNEKFKELFNAHLAQYFLSLSKCDEMKLKTAPKLVLKSINEIDDISDNLIIQKYKIPSLMSYEDRLQDLKETIYDINTIHLTVESIFSPVIAQLKVYELSIDFEIEEPVKTKILQFSKDNNIDLSDDFFDLGEAKRNLIAPIPGKNEPKIRGSEQEKQKYDKICYLANSIDDHTMWTNIENNFSNLSVIKLVLENSGNSFDEDVDIDVIFPLSELILHENLPQLNPSDLNYFYKNYSWELLFAINQTEKYTDYKTSLKNGNRSNSPISEMFLESDYVRELDETFCYAIFKKNNNVIIRLHINYIKQHTAIAFPTPLFIKDNCRKIHYKITSKHNHDIVEGELKAG